MFFLTKIVLPINLKIMKETDLMIGDYLYWGKDKIVKVQMLRKYGDNFGIDVVYNDSVNLYFCTDNDDIYSCNIDELKPIPLTPEILEKIGFVAQPNIGYVIDDWDGTQIIYDRWNHNLRIIKNYKTCLDIETFDDIAVHELQHAFKLCEIEKEITL